jgi:penicillin amidase
MKLFKKILIGLVVVVILAFVAGLIYLRYIATRAIPDYNQNVNLRNMKAPVTVYRDEFAIPHVYAQNEEDLYRAVGYVMAQDRLWQMDLVRRATTGRLAEIFGEDLFETDLLMRSLRMTEKSQRILEKTDKKMIKALEAFADGINQYIERNKNKLPPEFSILGYVPEKWELFHSVNLVGFMAWDLTFAWSAEVLLHKIAQKVDAAKFKEMIPNIPLQETPVFPDFSLPLNASELELKTRLLTATQKLEELGLGVFCGSNNWAISGKKSTTGKPILANDMHLGLFTPGIWYQMHQVVEDQLNVTGVVLPGQPFIVVGHNDHIAWGMTNVMVDDMDFYLEKINPENPYQYKFNGEWKDMKVINEKIKTREGKIIEEELKFTHRGPIISQFKDIKKEAISMHWIGNEYSNELRTIYLLNRAKNWDDFRDAVKTFIAISQNIVYADVEGNIGLQTCAGVPIRKGSGIAVVPGETDEYDWTGTVPFEELPYCFNPECGYVSSANNKTTNDDYPYYISHWFIVPDRINRIREMLEEKETFSIDDFKKMHADFKSKHVERFLGDIVDILKEADTLDVLNGVEKQALQQLSQWDGVLTRESTAASIFEKLYLVMVKNLILDELGEDLYNQYLGNKILLRNLMVNVWRNKNSAWCDNIHTESKETFSQWVKTSFKETVQQLKLELGDNPDGWQWGKIHRFTLKHPMGQVKLLARLFNLNRGPFEVGGSFHTVCPYSYPFGNPFMVNYGASQRHIYSTADWDQSQTIIPTGTSGIPASPYYCDQTKRYLKNKYHNDFVSKKWVVENARYIMVISSDKERKED